MNKVGSEKRPWYREGMVWLVIAIPASAVLVGLAMLTVAIKTWDGVVVDDYYKHGKEINRVLVRDHFAAENGLSAFLNWPGDDGRVSVSVSSREPMTVASTIELRFIHPTLNGLDQAISLARGPDDVYHGLLQSLPAGDWIIQVGTDQWRLNARSKLGLDPSIVEFNPVFGS